MLTRPLLVVIGDKPGGFGAYRDGQEIYGRAASKDKRLLVVACASHYDLYGRPEPTRQAIEAATEFFGPPVSPAPPETPIRTSTRGKS